jgi:hypothetical protein
MHLNHLFIYDTAGYCALMEPNSCERQDNSAPKVLCELRMYTSMRVLAVSRHTARNAMKLDNAIGTPWDTVEAGRLLHLNHLFICCAMMEPDKAANGKTTNVSRSAPTALCQLCMYVEMRVLTVAV